MTKKRTTLRVLSGLAALLLAIGISACGGGSETSSDSVTASSKGDSTSEASTADDKRVSIAMELTLTGLEFAQEQKQGMEAFAAEDGNVELEISGPPDTNPEVAQEQAMDMLAKSPDAMGISPFPPELWTRTMKTISEQVPNVLVFSERPSSELSDVSSAPIQTLVGFDDKALGREILEETIKLAKLPKSTTGDVILGQCEAGESGVLAQRTEGFEDAVSKLLPNTTIEKFTSGSEPQANLESWTTELGAHPNPVLVTGTCDPDAASAYKIKKRTGADFVIGAVELPPETIEGLKDGSITAAVAANHWLVGYASTRLLAEAARGGEMPEGFINAGFHLFTGKDIPEVEERANDPAKFYETEIKELFGGGTPEAEPITDAWK